MNAFMEHDFTISDITTCCYVPVGAGKPVHKNRHSNGLALHLSGQKRYTFESGESIDVFENDMIFLPKGSNYHVTSLSPGDCYAINFQCPGDLRSPPFSLHCHNAAPLIDAFSSATKHWKRKNEDYKLKCFSELYHILYHFKREYRLDYFANSKQDLIAPAVKYIQNNYTGEVISVSKLAGLCRISEVYLRKLFNEVYGTSPLKYINNMKIELAKELLLSRLYSVSDITALTGFSDECVFSREFKKSTGLSPRAFLAEHNSADFSI